MSLAELQQMSNSLKPETPMETRFASMVAIEQGTWRLVAEDRLKEPTEFRQAGVLMSMSQPSFATNRTVYELFLTSLSGGDDEAKKQIGRAWDNLLVAMSRGRRLGVEKIASSFAMERYRLRPTAKVVRTLFADPTAFLAKSKGSSDNATIKALVDADQKARQADWSKFKQEDFERLAQEDNQRLKSIRNIVNKGELKTAEDFSNAALVCQHGQTFEDYALAHELSVGAIMLGDKSASWLAGASYDRMFSNSGYPQRFATQYSMNGGVTKLNTFDPEGINDTMRKMVVHHTLADAQNRKWN